MTQTLSPAGAGLPAYDGVLADVRRVGHPQRRRLVGHVVPGMLQDLEPGTAAVPRPAAS